ncbi:MAG TPA: CBS domain-containing protein [Kofleriaceae bacterium]|jgi:CBS domain-containing protein|nr:CBS domain-containing protein [Kofleriaceae bacterium]
MTVEELMTKSPTNISNYDTLDRAAQKLWDNDCGVLPVVGGDGRLVGIITDRDICMSAWSRGQLLSTIHVDEAMSKQVFSVTPDQDVDAALQLMADNQVRRLPVVDAEGKPIGILSLSDLACEATRTGSKLTDGIHRAIHTIAAICQPRKRMQKAA